MDARKKNIYRPLLIAGLISLLIHLELAVLMPSLAKVWETLVPRPKTERLQQVDLVTVSRAEWDQNLKAPGAARVEGSRRADRRDPQEQERLAAAEKAKEELLIKQREEEDRAVNGQVVDVAPTANDARPKNAKLLSERNTNVEKESVSRHRRKDYGVAQPRPTIGGFSPQKPDPSQNPAGRDEIAILTHKQGQGQGSSSGGDFAFEIPTMQKRDALKLKLDLDTGTLPRYQASQQVQGNSDRLRLSSTTGGPAGDQGGDGGQDEVTVTKFKKPRLDELAMVTGAPANDHIDGIPEGEETLLNTREFRYATFFNRIKRSVSEHWSPGEVYLRNDPYGNVFGVKDRYTVLNVTLDGAGELKDVAVAQRSELDFLDDEAIRAFRNASPFPNPPKGLLEGDGLIHFQFGFFFEIGERPRIRAFRSSPYPY